MGLTSAKENVPRIIGYFDDLRGKVRNLLEGAVAIPHCLHNHLRHLHGAHGVKMAIRGKNVYAAAEKIEDFGEDDFLVLGEIGG